MRVTSDLQFDTVLDNLRISEGSVSFTMPWSDAIAEWSKSIGKHHDIILRTGKPVSQRLRILRRILRFFYGWAGYRPSYAGETVYRFKAVMSQIDRTANSVSVDMTDITDLTVGVE